VTGDRRKRRCGRPRSWLLVLGSRPTAAAPSAGAGVPPSGARARRGHRPGDGALLLATHEGLIAVGADGGLTPTGPVIDLTKHRTEEEREAAVLRHRRRGAEARGRHDMRLTRR
jgi:hypothetical protein